MSEISVFGELQNYRDIAIGNNTPLVPNRSIIEQPGPNFRRNKTACKQQLAFDNSKIVILLRTESVIQDLLNAIECPRPDC